MRRLAALALLTMAPLVLLPAIAGATPANRPGLHVLAVGVNHYDRGGLGKLPGSVPDALAVCAAFQAQAGKAFAHVHATALLDAKATAKGILAALAKLGPTAKDVAWIHLSGHGRADLKTGAYAYCASDRDLSWPEIEAALRVLPGKVVVVLDTCQAHAAAGGRNVTVLCGSRGGEQGWQLIGPPAGGVFTRELLKGLSAKGGPVTLGGLMACAAPATKAASPGHQAPQVIGPTTEPGMGGLVLAVPVP